MPRERHAVTELQRQKQLLVAEAELQREELRRDLVVVRYGVEHLARRAQTLAISGALAWAGLAAFRRTRVPPTPNNNGKPASWVGRIVTGARLAAEAWKTWSSFKARNR